MNGAKPTATSKASVPLSIRSIFVNTPKVRIPSGSTSFANFSASEFAKFEFAAVMAIMTLLRLLIYSSIIVLTSSSMLRLVAHWDFGNAREVDEGDVDYLGGVDFEVDGSRC